MLGLSRKKKPEEMPAKEDVTGQIIHGICPHCATPLNIATSRVPDQPTHEISLNYFGRIIITVRGISPGEVWDLYSRVNASLPHGPEAKEKVALDQFVR